MNLLIIACATGFIGDAILQITGIGNNGLASYFQQHGRAESLFIAGGMMTGFYSIFLLFKIPLTFLNLALFGVIIDLLFRKTRIFPSLDGYYEMLNYGWSAFWMALPMCIPLIIKKIMKIN